ncbi:venom factor-like [Mercenaria mercenaria]|uniref:venom factor-like n=1 Tax=Mercenaria mercenaria TaxID=6596 RepID=UPI00234F18C3|nr:venom factor-like [Mercenaria mercenaria]
MTVVAFCFVIGALIVSCYSSEYYFVVAPNVIRFDHQETVTVSIFGSQRNVAVTVWLEHRNKQISTKTVTVADEQNPVQTTLRVTEDDLFDSVIDEKPRNIRICSRRGFESSICRDLVLSYKTGYLIVQTDKPIYTPLQKVRIRVLALDESLKKVSGDKWQLSLDIVSPSNLTLGRRVFTKTKASGFYQNDFTLPPYPEIGMWTARAFYMGQFETIERALFQVKEYVLPTFGVSIDVSEPHLLESFTGTITITVKATYVYKKAVDGSARISLNITDSMGDSQYLLDMDKKSLENGIGEFSVNISDIFATDALAGKDFPDGSRLLVVATVFESATGKEESSFHDDTVFATKPYIFKFTRSKRHFRPGMEYFVKVDVFTPNKQPASGEKIKVQKLDDSDQVLEEKETTTDDRGQALAIVSTPNSKILKFKVLGPNAVQMSEVLEVTAYDDKNQIQVERIITDDDIMLMKAFTNIQLDASGNARSGYTGMLFLIVSRGKVVHTVFKPPSNKVSEQIKEDLQKLINPTARLLVFYVDEGTDKVVADSIKIEVDPKCRGDDLTLTPHLSEVLPGAGGELTITGTPYTWVGLNAMDKALLLLNDKNVLRKNKMFDVLESHDLGCGEGSGKNNGDVFKNAGLTILTNARVESDVDRISEDCVANARKKRAADDCFGTSIKCCNYGSWYAKTVFYEKKTGKERVQLDSYTLCYTSAKAFAVHKTLGYSTKCILAILYSCIEQLDTLISGITRLASRSLSDISQYASDLELLAQHKIRPHKRTDFRESFLFDELQLNEDGEAKKQYVYPDSITSWMIQAIGITKNEGICIADPIDVRTFREFFIQLDLPYKATRLEMFDVKATIFNYGTALDPDKQVNMYLEAVEGLCYSNEPGKPSPRKYLEMSPNSANTVKFPMVPLTDGLFPITVTAIVTNLGIPQVDVIEKKLHVVNEGIQEIITVQVCLDPNEQREDCESHKRVTTHYGISTSAGTREQVSTVDLTLPKIALPGTGSATAYLQGNIMDNVVKTILSGVESLFRCPHGCGEQTIATTAPNVYAMMYLKQTKQITADIEVTGNTNIRNGVNREKTMFRHSDGSYSCCISRATSVWLTAFVAKVFCHAKTVVDDVLDEQTDLLPTINFLNDHINARGEFVEILDIRSGSWLKGATETGSTPSLTSFVLISLLECSIFHVGINRTVDVATRYIENLDENWLKGRPFDLAISTYALALAKSNKANEFKKWLHSIQKKNGKNIYWGNSDSDPANAYTVETTAYALLAMLKFNDEKNAAYIVRWLTSQQDSYGVFRSTQDTVVGLQALSEYSIRTYSPEIDLQVSMTANGWSGKQLSVKAEKFKLQQIVNKLPVERGDNKMKVLVTGTSGSGRMRIELRYNRAAKDDEICPFRISDIEVGNVYKYPMDQNIAKLRQCDVCGECAGDPDNVNDHSLTTPEPAPTTTPTADNISSNFGRKKRQASGKRVDKMKCIRFSVRAKEGHQHGMSMIYFNLETDVTVLKEDMEKLVVENENLDDFEMPSDGKGFVVFYLNTLTSHENNFVFRLVDNFDGDVNSRQPVSVDVFDYYNPDQYCRKIYGTGLNQDVSVDYRCDSKNTQCKCLQSTCSKPVENEISKMIKMIQRNPRRKNLPKPALQLKKYTCNLEKANYAVYVEVEHVWPDIDTKNTMARAVVKRNIHQGAYAYEKDDELIFYWKSSCPHPKLEVGKQYYIIAKDGHEVSADNEQTEYHCSLMGSALAIQPSAKIRKALSNYEALIKAQRCMQ